MAVQQVLLLGHPKLYEVCEPVRRDEVEGLEPVIQDLHDTLFDFRRKYGVGRAIAAPQIGVMKRIVYMYISSPTVFFNPVIDQQSSEMITMWDDCMCFPDLVVQVRRHRVCRITFLDRGLARADDASRRGSIRTASTRMRSFGWRVSHIAGNRRQILCPAQPTGIPGLNSRPVPNRYSSFGSTRHSTSPRLLPILHIRTFEFLPLLGVRGSRR